MSTDKTLFAIVGSILDFTFTMGNPSVGLFAVLNSGLKMNPETILGIKDTSSAIESSFNDNILHCEIWPGSNQEWLLTSD